MKKKESLKIAELDFVDDIMAGVYSGFFREFKKKVVINPLGYVSPQRQILIKFCDNMLRMEGLVEEMYRLRKEELKKQGSAGLN